MVGRIFKFSIAVVLVAILVFFLTQKQYQKPIKQAWRNVQRSDGWKTVKKTWEKSYRKTQQLVTKIQQGKLSEEIGSFLDASSRTYLGVGLGDLHGHLQKVDSRTVGTILFIVWVVLGYLFYRLTSTGTSFFMMAISLLTNSVYGQAWCLYQLCVLTGLGMYVVSLIANNVVLAAIIVVIIYTINTCVFFLSSPEGSTSNLEEKIDHVGYCTRVMEQKVSLIDKKLDRIMKRKNRSSSGDE